MYALCTRCVLLGAGLTLSACAFFSKGDALSPRFFSPEPALESASPSAARAGGLELRLGQIDSAAHLELRIAYRLSATELGYYDDRRWTEPPEEYLRRALEHELFDRRGLRRVVSGPAATLDVELLGFEELRHGAERARVALRFVLHDDRHTLIEHGISVEQPLGAEPKEPAAVAVAISAALARAVTELADGVISELQARPGGPAEQEVTRD